MEDRQFDPNEEKQPSKPSSERRSDETFWQFLLRRRESQDSKDEEETEENSVESSKKRRWRLFKGFFTGLISGESVATSGSSESTLTQKESSISWNSIQSSEYSPDVNNDQPETTAIPLVTTETSAIASDESIEQSQLVAPEDEPDNNLTQNNRLNTERQQSDAFSGPLGSPQADRLSPASTTETVTTVHEQERVVERGVGMALPVVLVGAEYLARKRADKRIHKDVVERTTDLKQEINRNNIAQQQLETLVRQNREQLENLKQERGIRNERAQQIRSDEVHKTTIEQPKFNEELLSREDKLADQENILQYKQPELQKNRAPKNIEAEKTFAENPVESKDRTERMIERSHEIKDQSNTPVVATSVGSIMASSPMVNQHSGNLPSDLPGASPSGLPVVSDEQANIIYKQAMKMGFWSAIVIIIFGVLAYLVLK